MSIIQNPKRISSESLSSDEAKEAVNSVGSSINSYLEQSYNVIMGGINIADNLDQYIKNVIVTVDINGIPKNPVKFNVSLRAKAQGIVCIRSFLAYPTNQPFISYTQNNNTITINHISGLTADTKYQLVLLIIGG